MGETFPRNYGSYILLERLGSGGMSEVDLARRSVDETSFVRFAVIKRIKADRTSDPSFVRMFKDEARITSELHHEKIGSVYDFGKVDDEYYLALEYVPGLDGRQLVNVLRERGQRVPVRVALKIVVDVLEALQYAHFKKDTFGRPMGIVHRDVNPRNVMLSIRGEVKLIDFGVAKATDRLERTRTDHVKGKFAYMAPEQISGAAIDHRTDLYAAGLLLHELLTGVSPFFGLNQVQILHRMVNATVDPLPPVPELADDSKLRKAHARALAADMNQRYQSAAEFAADLRAIAEPMGGIPTDDQLANFLRNVEPELAARLESKMESYSKLEDNVLPGTRASQPLLDETLGGDSSSKSSPSAIRMRQLLAASELSGTLTVARTGVLAGSVMLVSIASALIASALVLAVLLVAYLATGGFGQQQTQLPPIQPPVEVKPPTTPIPEPEPEFIEPRTFIEPPVERPVAPSAPDPATPEPVILPDPQPLEPSPVPDPVPVPIPDPMPAVLPEPTPAPAISVTGKLQVTAPDKGLDVKANGETVGETPLNSSKFPVGTYTIEVPGYTCSPRSVSVQKDRVSIVTCK